MHRIRAFSGTYTALVTPFDRGGAVDELCLRALVERQIKEGVDGVVPVGTTGESPTLSHEEHRRVVEIVLTAARDRCKVLAGTGSNSTDEAISLTHHAASAGADGCLLVAPYYNKPTQAGLIAHFQAIAEAVKIPLVLYNIPGRCGVEIAVETVAQLSRNPNIVGIKEAAGSTDRVSQLREVCGRNFTILSGDDSMTLPMMAVGADGVISVASNLVARDVVEMVRLARGGQFKKAQQIHARLFPLFKDLFIETNPVPIKAAMAMAGLLVEKYRLPLCPMSSAHRAQLRQTLRQLLPAVVGLPAIRPGRLVR